MSQPVVLARGATLSACAQYRYDLYRAIDLGGRTSQGDVVFVMLNPSTADAFVEDPTIRRCIGYAHDWGYGELWVVNLFGLRATKPTALKAHSDPVGPLNDRFLHWRIAAACRVVLAWGDHRVARERERDILLSLETTYFPAYHRFVVLGWTKGRHPRHPLYMKADVVPQPA